MNFNPEDYKDKVIYIAAPLANNSATQRAVNLKSLMDTCERLKRFGLETTTNDYPAIRECDVLWIMKLPCSLNDSYFSKELQEIYLLSTKPFSLLSYPDLNLEPIRYHSKFLTKEPRRLTFK